MNTARVRGSYKAYLRNNAAVPYSTLRYQQQVSRIPQPAYEVSIMVIKSLKYFQFFKIF